MFFVCLFFKNYFLFQLFFFKISDCLILKNSFFFWSKQNYQVFFYVHIKDEHLYMYILDYLYGENNFSGGIILSVESTEARLENQGGGSTKKLPWGIKLHLHFRSSTDSVLPQQTRQNLRLWIPHCKWKKLSFTEDKNRDRQLLWISHCTRNLYTL